MNATMDVAEAVAAIARSLVADAPDEEVREAASRVVRRLDGPLRVAIAGRVKAGKSTLLNALVGDRLAPTDAGECTRLVTVYQRGPAYDVAATLTDGSRRPLTFERRDGALDVDLGALDERSVDRLEIAWPTSALDSMTLIDTPGLASIHDENSRRTRDFLDRDDADSDADAVVYLLHHVHADDITMLDAFMDRTVTAASPVNSIGVLSRADEIGGGRRDAMESATRVAARCAAHPQVGRLCSTVVPLVGLLAETGLTLREDEAAALRTLAATPPEVLERMLMSADQFCETSSSALTAAIRRGLLARLGMFGARIAVDEVLSGRATTAATLGPFLVQRSGLPALRSVLQRQFAPRAKVLQARSAVVSLRSIARSVRGELPDLAADIDRRVEQVEATTVQLAQARALHLVMSGAAVFDAGARDELELLFSGGPPSMQLGLAPTVTPETLAQASLDRIAQWRQLAADPLADPQFQEVCETAARTLEGIYFVNP